MRENEKKYFSVILEYIHVYLYLVGNKSDISIHWYYKIFPLFSVKLQK